MSFFETIGQLIDSSYQTLVETGLYKNPNDVLPFMKLPKGTIVTKVAGHYSESWWIVELACNGKKEIGFIVRNVLTTFITLEKSETELSVDVALPRKFNAENIKKIVPRADVALLQGLVSDGKTLFPRQTATGALM
jgi:hypothetical protein